MTLTITFITHYTLASRKKIMIIFLYYNTSLRQTAFSSRFIGYFHIIISLLVPGYKVFIHSTYRYQNSSFLFLSRTSLIFTACVLLSPTLYHHFSWQHTLFPAFHSLSSQRGCFIVHIKNNYLHSIDINLAMRCLRYRNQFITKGTHNLKFIFGDCWGAGEPHKHTHEK